MSKRIMPVLFILVVACVAKVFVGIEKSKDVFSDLPVSGKIIIIDPGHGGWDPGKAGLNGEDEKEINLKIAERIRDYLEQGGAFVYLTRQDDSALGKTKNEDMKKRIAYSRDENADLFISIHQNAFPSASAKGAQVFYYEKSNDGKAVAECIQNRLVAFADESNTRVAKENNNYYVLKNTDVPAVIIECGFLSNPDEEKRLNSEEYRDRLAWAVYMGIWDYFDGENFT